MSTVEDEGHRGRADTRRHDPADHDIVITAFEQLGNRTLNPSHCSVQERGTRDRARMVG